MKILHTFLALLSAYTLVLGQAQTRRVLFIGNSYTYVNSLPQVVADIADVAGDSLYYDFNTPGGYTFQGHASDATTLSKIALGGWDYVVLQEQSQRPSFPIGQVRTQVFPYAKALDSAIHVHNACAETVFYMTWGYKNGDASNCAGWAPVCTYQGMDSMLNLRYRMMADSHQAVISPVGAVRNRIRQLYPTIELYQADESHPSVEGTYAAAFCFYTTLYRKDPTLVAYNGTLPAADAANIRAVVKAVVFDSLSKWHIGEYDPQAGFVLQQNGNNAVTFTNQSQHASSYQWNFGDNTSDTTQNPQHTYAQNGTYTVTLVSSKCGKSDTFSRVLNILPTGVENSKNSAFSWHIFPNPVQNTLQISTNIALSGEYSYQILNPQGQILQTYKPLINNQLETHQLPEGLYFIQLYHQSQHLGTQKFVKTN